MHRYSLAQRLRLSTRLTRCIRSISNGKADPIQVKRGQRAKYHYPRSVVGLSLFALGGSAAAYAVYYALYAQINLWPKQLREDLRSGLRARRERDLDVAALCLARAWKQTKSMHLSSFGPDPHLKISGIAIILASVLEQAGKKESAYRVYEDALLNIINDPSNALSSSSLNTDSLDFLSVAEGIRAMSIAYKLGELAQELKKPIADEEMWLEWSVEASLKILIKQGLRPNHTRNPGKTVQTMLDELPLPSWATLHNFAAPFEALGTFYARRGKINYSIPLYLKAISVLIPPESKGSSTDDQCRGAQLMGNIAELILRDHPSDRVPTEILTQAEAWAAKGLDITESARQKHLFRRNEICEEGYAVLLFNMAMIKKFGGDVGNARKLFGKSLDQAKAISMTDGISQAQAALTSLPGAS